MQEVGISLPTSFKWRHKILSAIRGLEGGISFSGITEADELLMQYSEKGRKYKTLEEKEQAMNTVHPNVAVLVMTDRKVICFSNTLEKIESRIVNKRRAKAKSIRENLICFKPMKSSPKQ